MPYEFKKGDRVRRINIDNNSYFKVGDIGVVSEECRCSDMPIVYVTSNNRKTINLADNLELAKEEKSKMFKEQFVGGTIHTNSTGARVSIYMYLNGDIQITIESQSFDKEDLIELRDLLTKIIDIKYPKDT